MKVVNLKLTELHAAPWNANRVPAAVLAKIKKSIERYGVVENLVVRPMPPSQNDGQAWYEVLSGNHRLGLYGELGMKTAPCYVIELDDAHARLLAQTLNRTRGEDDPEAYESLIREVLNELPQGDVLDVLPETEASLKKLLGELPSGSGHGDGDELDRFKSQYGVIVMCESEATQQAAYEDLTAHGYECRVVVT